MASRLVGRVHFTASLDGDKVPRDARAMGEKAGAEGAKGYDRTWSKGFESTLTKSGRESLRRWEANGRSSGTVYGRALNERLGRFLSQAEKNFSDLRLQPGFLDDFNKKFGDAGLAAGELQRQLVTLNNEGKITEQQFGAAKRQVDDWVLSQRSSAAESNRQRDALAQLNDQIRTQVVAVREMRVQEERVRAETAQHARARENLLRVEREHVDSIRATSREWSLQNRLAREVDEKINGLIDSNSRLSLSWRDLSHNGRQWTLIIGAVTAALPELAGLGSAAGSGLFALAGAAAAGGVGLTALISGVVVLNRDLEKLPPELREARKGLDDFKGSFSELGESIGVRAFRDSERDFRSLASTVRGLGGDFGPVADSAGRLTREFAEGIAPGTRNYENLRAVVRNSAPEFETIMRSVGRIGEGLLAGLANPAAVRTVGNLTGYVYDLSDGFADFLEGDRLDDWLRHGEAVFGSFGNLLGTTGRLLDDLVTPGSINRLTTFMDNVALFLDTGGRGILGFADELNAFGLISEVLARVGVALEPLRDPVIDLAAAVSGALTPAIEGGADVLGGLATAAAPVVQTLADLIAVAPPGAWQALGAGLAIVGSGLLVIRGARGIQTIVGDLRGLNAEGGKTPSILGKIGRAAGLIGLGVTGVTLLAGGLEELYQKVRNFDDISRNTIATSGSLSSVWDQLGTSAFGNSQDITDMSAALDQVGNVGPRVEQLFPTLVASFSESGRQASQLSTVLSKLSPELATLANQDVQAAATQFSAWSRELGATDAQVLNMLNAMPEFKQALIDVSTQTTGTASDQQLLALALGGSADASSRAVGGLQEVAGQAVLTGEEVDSLAEKIRNFGNENLSAREANRQFYDAVQSLTGAFAENGNTLDVTTEAGRRNEAALDALAQATLTSAAATLEQTGKQDDATASIQRGRDELIRQLGQFGITGQAAEDYANELGLIPGDVATLAQFEDNDARVRVANFISSLNAIPRNKTVTIGVVGGGLGAFLPETAIGGTFNGAQARVIAEDGPEAVVPLNRPLSQVEPSVRWLSAIAQGKAGAPAATGVPPLHIEEGAIQVYDRSGDSRQTAKEVLREFTEYAAG